MGTTSLTGAILDFRWSFWRGSPFVPRACIVCLLVGVILVFGWWFEWVSLARQDIRQVMHQRDAQSRAGNSTSNATSRLDQLLSNLDGKVQAMHSHLDKIQKEPDTYHVSPNEVRRMESELHTVETQLEGFRSSASQPPNRERERLMEGGREPAQYGGAGSGAAAPTEQDMVMSMDRKMEEQDQMLDGIGAQAGLLDEMGRTIGENVDRSTHIMGDLEGDVDTAHEHLNRETRRTKYAHQQTGNCIMYIIIFILIALMIVLLSVPGKS